MPREIRMIRGIFVYVLYYTTCICGALDLAKTQILTKNLKMACYFLSLVIAFQTLVAAMLFDNIIFILVPPSPNGDDIKSMNWYILKIIDILTTILSVICMSSMLFRELKELKMIQGSEENSLVENAVMD